MYVDDILSCSMQCVIDRFTEDFMQAFCWITLEIGNKHSYLGMQLTFKQGLVEVDMQ